MSNEQVKAIELKGIVHNSTKINTQDGQCEDIINLRCKDGSWRTSGDGRSVHSMTDGSVYSQLFVHTNIYRHLLGVKDGKLYWFANISTDGVSFSELKNSDNKPSPVLICSVTDDLFITQTGHLLTIIDGEKNYVYALFNAMNSTYKVLNVDENGSVYDRKLYPFGEVHFNLDCEAKKNIYTNENKEAGEIKMDSWGCGKYDINYTDSGAVVNDSLVWHSDLLKMINKATEDNHFTMPFMAIIAVKLYDGSYIYASTPVLLYPFQWKNTRYSRLLYIPKGFNDETNQINSNDEPYIESICVNIDTGKINYYDNTASLDAGCLISQGASKSKAIKPHTDPHSNKYLINCTGTSGRYLTTRVVGTDLLLSLQDISILNENSDIFTGIGIFITKPICTFYKEENKKGNSLAELN